MPPISSVESSLLYFDWHINKVILLLDRSPPRGIDQPEYLLPIISVMFRIVSSTDDPMLWNQSFGFEEALISCSEKVLMRPGESELENRTVKQADGAFTRYNRFKFSLNG